MLIRIVRMTFEKENVPDFLNVFESSKSKIRSFDGCQHLELWKDYHAENSFTTYSIWDNEDTLNNYRDSELFKSVWQQTKALFKEKPIAFSNKNYTTV